MLRLRSRVARRRIVQGARFEVESVESATRAVSASLTFASFEVVAL